MRTKNNALLKLRLADSTALDADELIELPEGVSLVTNGMEKGHYRVIGYVWRDSMESDELHCNEAGLTIIKEREGLRLFAYTCSAGVATIGFGATRINGSPVKLGMSITKEQAEDLLAIDIKRFESGIKLALKSIEVPEEWLNENQFSALVSLCYNCGLAPLREGNTIAKALQGKDYDAAADGFLLWNKAGGKVLNGLVRRREDERQLFLTPVK
ncbi:MAG: lysozyme [Cyanobacteria bacterium J06633_2]